MKMHDLSKLYETGSLLKSFFTTLGGPRFEDVSYN